MEKLGKRLKAHEEDLNVEFEELTGHEESSIQDFFENNKNLIIGGLIAVVLLAAGYGIWGEMQKGKNEKVSEASFPQK